MQIYCNDLTGMALSFATAKTLQWKFIKPHESSTGVVGLNPSEDNLSQIFDYNSPCFLANYIHRVDKAWQLKDSTWAVMRTKYCKSEEGKVTPRYFKAKGKTLNEALARLICMTFFHNKVANVPENYLPQEESN